MFKNFLRTAIALGIVGTLFAYSLVPAFAYTVQGGDTLGKIAAANNISVAELMELNGITDANQIYKGEDLKVSKADTTVVTRQAEGSPFKSAEKTTTTISAKGKAMLKGMFDLEYYKKANPDVVAALGDDENALFNHFCKYGIWEGRQVNPDFNVSAYASAYSDLTDAAKANKMSAADEILFLYQHYEAFGKTENREVTTVEKAAEKGIAVVSVASAKTADGKPMAGTVIAAPAPKEEPAPSTPTHVHSLVYTPDDTSCHGVCSCGHTDDVPHHYASFNGTCDDCGHTHSNHLSETVIHEYGTWTINPTGHYNFYSECGATAAGKTRFEAHNWNGDNECDDCGYTCTEHYWNGDDTCDYCGTTCSHNMVLTGSNDTDSTHEKHCTICLSTTNEAHSYSGGTCTVCYHVCTHDGETPGTTCTKCGESVPVPAP